MARKAPKQAAKSKTTRRGWRKLSQEAPTALDMATGDEIEGTLGPAFPDRLNPQKRTRILASVDGRYWLNGAAFEQAGLFDLPTGTRVVIEKTKDVPIKGRPQPMKGYAVYVPELPENGEADDGLPF